MIKNILIISSVILNFFFILFLGKYIPVEIALYKISKNEYTDTYVCKDFARDLVDEFEKIGIQSSIILGEDQETIKDEKVIHAWVGIWVEPQTGGFTNNFTIIDKYNNN